MTFREAVAKCKAQGLITVLPSPPRSRKMRKNVWSDSAREKQRLNQARAWTPERRAAMSRLQKERRAALRASAGLKQLQEMNEREGCA